ncbi:hyperosmotically inducible protein [Massilia sp. UYP11]|uniref:BON domain-containing protein n=1 Tax=Massilia sp. UYP11 TaxID=1756385 RepID=UPI003D23C023
MKTLIATLIASAVAAVAVAPAHAAPVDRDAHRAAMDKAAADYRSAKARCDARSGNAGQVCDDEAKLAQARAELDAYTRHDSTGANLRDARAKVIRAEHALADTQCDASAAGDKDRCQATAGSIRDAALARLDDRDGATAVGGSGGAGLVARTDTLDPRKAAAVQKCQEASGNAHTACVIDERGNVTTAAGVTATTGAAVAASTREAAANAAENTREAARNAADKTREVASNVAEKTGMAGAGERTREALATVKEKTAVAVDRTKEMASNAVRKTENATERAAEKTVRVAADSTITTKVKAGLVADPDLKGMEISVDTEGGVVMLSGFVASKAEADKAMQLARDVDGVTSVRSAIKVK